MGGFASWAAVGPYGTVPPKEATSLIFAAPAIAGGTQMNLVVRE
jgi:hypothetical protein